MYKQLKFNLFTGTFSKLYVLKNNIASDFHNPLIAPSSVGMYYGQ